MIITIALFHFYVFNCCRIGATGYYYISLHLMSLYCTFQFIKLTVYCAVFLCIAPFHLFSLPYGFALLLYLLYILLIYFFLLIASWGGDKRTFASSVCLAHIAKNYSKI